MFRTIAFVFLIAIELSAIPSSHGDETKALIEEVVGKLKTFESQWNEGYLSGTVRGDDGYADLKIWWVGDRSRRDIIDYGIDGKREPRHHVYIINRQTTCTFNPESLVANCNRRIIQPEIPPVYRILPAEAWVEILPTRPIADWLMNPPATPGISPLVKGTRVGDEYVFFTGPKSAVERCLVAANSGRPLPDLANDERVARTAFNSSGLLTASGHVGSPTTNTIEFKYSWTSDTPPRPVELLRQSIVNESIGTRVMIRITVLEASNQLPKDSPSMSVPPDDLPFSTHIMDRTGATMKNYFIGGADGQIASELRRSGKAMRKVLDK